MFSTLKAFLKPTYYITSLRLKGSISSKAFVAPGVHIDLSGGGNLRMEDNTVLGPGTMIWTQGGDITIAKGSRIGPACVLYGHGGLKIGKDVIVGAQTVMVPANHIFSDLDLPIKMQGHTAYGITIEDNVWIGAGVKILDGVTIGHGSVLAAGSVITRDVPALSVMAGVPARQIKHRN